MTIGPRGGRQAGEPRGQRRLGAGPPGRGRTSLGRPRPAGPAERRAFWDFDSGTAAAAGLCRTVTRQIMTEVWGLDALGTLVDDAMLIVSELVTNVHRHVAPQRATITLAWSGDTLSIGVGDRSPVLPVAPPRPREGGPGGDWTGWGLRLVEATAAAYGGGCVATADPGGGGKTVIVTLPVPAARAPGG